MSPGPNGGSMAPVADVAASALPAGGASRNATWSLWLGLLGVVFGALLMFTVLTPAAILYGVRGLREIRAQPELTGRTRAWAGILLGLVAPVLWVGVFVAFLVDGIG